MADKEAIREAVWDALEEADAARFPFPPHGRIPNFDGADAAAQRLCTLPWWADVEVVKCNPDAPQRPLRERALREGRRLLMARPRLRDERPFVLLDGSAIDDPADAATIGGAEEYGRPLALDELPVIDAIVCGSVAVDRHGRRIGKGEGYSDLEFATLLETERIDAEVTIATTVHPIQLRDGPLLQDDHDVPLDAIITPETAVVATDRPGRPDGIDWSRLDPARLTEMPAIADLQPDDRESGAVS